MALGTIDRTPRPSFARPVVATKPVRSALAVFLMIADGPSHHPADPGDRRDDAIRCNALLMPVEAIGDGRDYLGGWRTPSPASSRHAAAGALVERAQRTEQLSEENARLRALLELRPIDVRSQPAGCSTRRPTRTRAR
jgi:rod shape-determining protein MreC